MYKILFVDDDQQYQSVITELLTLEGYDVTTSNNAINGLELFKNNNYDLILTDLKMNSIDGLQFLTIIRKIDPYAKVIIVTGSTNDIDEIKGLELKVDDYIKKPVSLEILLKRIDNVIRTEKQIVSQKLLESGTEQLKVDLKSRKVMKVGQPISLTRKEFDILVLFLKNKNIVLDREEIIQKVWHTPLEYVDTRTIDTHIKKLRAKLALTAIYSVRGIGYEWVE